MKETAKISVIMLTFNHGPFLNMAIEGVLNQQTDFPFELIICNDASPDNSDGIIQSYSKRYPEIIRYYRHDKNIGFVENQRFAFQQAAGKYVAYCEGDDFWTDKNKLQFQFDFLENNTDYVMTTARNSLLHEKSGKLTDDGKDYIFSDKEYVDYTQESFFQNRPTQTFTYLIIRHLIDLKWIDVYPNYRDLYYFYHVLEFGKGRAFNKNIGVYRLHDGGVFSSLETEKKFRTSIEIFSNIRDYNKDKRANNQIIKDLDSLVSAYFFRPEFPNPLLNVKLYRTIIERFTISKDLRILLLQILKTFKYSISR